MRPLFLSLVLFGAIAIASLDSKIYQSFTGNPCVLLLDKNGQYGCKTDHGGVTAPLHLIETFNLLSEFIKKPPSDPVILVMPVEIITLNGSVQAIQDTGKVKGVILLDQIDLPIQAKPFSPSYNMPDDKQANSGFVWNPSGNGLFRQRIPFPMWLLNVYDSEILFDKGYYNRNRSGVFPMYGAEIVAFMHPENVENSHICLRRGTCQPLGGHSTWTSIAPIDTQKEIVVATASIDSKSLFQLKSIGADSDMSGTIALMAAIDGLMSNPTINVSLWKRQPMFFFFDGENFGHMGTRKLFFDIYNTSCSGITGNSPFSKCSDGSSAEYKKIAVEKVVSLIEMKQIGSNKANGLYVHQQFHDMAGYTANTVLSAGRTIKDFSVSASSSSTPSIPPSCSTSLYSLNSTLVTKGVVITDHAAEYVNDFYESNFDEYETVAPTLICKAATLLLRTIYSIGKDVPPQSGPEFDSLNANCTLVQSLLECLTRNTTCPERLKILPGVTVQNADEWPIHYVGVYRGMGLTQHQKFIHDWVYNKTAFARGKECKKTEECGGENFNCVAGNCVKSATFLHEAVSTNVQFVMGDFSNSWKVIDPNSPEPLWAESNWQPLSLKIFLMGDPIQDYIFLGIAILEVILCIIAVVIVRRKFDTMFRVL